jgi:hypothetical protein
MHLVGGVMSRSTRNTCGRELRSHVYWREVRRVRCQRDDGQHGAGDHRTGQRKLGVGVAERCADGVTEWEWVGRNST